MTSCVIHAVEPILGNSPIRRRRCRAAQAAFNCPEQPAQCRYDGDSDDNSHRLTDVVSDARATWAPQFTPRTYDSAEAVALGCFPFGLFGPPATL